MTPPPAGKVARHDRQPPPSARRRRDRRPPHGGRLVRLPGRGRRWTGCHGRRLRRPRRGDHRGDLRRGAGPGRRRGRPSTRSGPAATRRSSPCTPAACCRTRRTARTRTTGRAGRPARRPARTTRTSRTRRSAAARPSRRPTPTYANPSNEVWLDLETNAAGNGRAQTVVDWTFRPTADGAPRSVILHLNTTSTGGTPPAGNAGARLACVTSRSDRVRTAGGTTTVRPVRAEADGVVDDASLVRAVAAGDREALETLYGRHAPWLVLRLTRRCNDRHLVDEAVQDTFVAVWRGARRWDGRRRGRRLDLGDRHPAPDRPAARPAAADRRAGRRRHRAPSRPPRTRCWWAWSTATWPAPWPALARAARRRAGHRARRPDHPRGRPAARHPDAAP